MEKRIELHCHTKMSQMRGLCDIRKLISKAQGLGISGIAVTDIDSVQAIPKISKELERARRFGRLADINEDAAPADFFYGVEVRLVDDGQDGSDKHKGSDKQESSESRETKAYSSIIIAKNNDGITNLYRLMTEALTDYSEGFPKIPKKSLAQNRKNLIIGSCAEGGEVSAALIKGGTDKEAKQAMSFYDFIEIVPHMNIIYPIDSEKRTMTEDEARSFISRTVRLGRQNKIPVIASSDVYYIEKKEKEAFKVLRYASGNKDLHAWKADHHLMTGEELMHEFSFLSEKDAKDVVYRNPAKLVEGIGTLNFKSDEKKYPKVPDAFKKLKKACKEKAESVYCAGIPEQVSERLSTEINNIKKNGFDSIYYINHLLVNKSNEAGYLVGTRGSVGASLVSYLSGISEMNPMPPHYYCRKCGFSDFNVYGIEGFHVGDAGIDLPDKACPKCGCALEKDGFDIPVETFLGFHFDKELDFDLNFAKEYQETAQEELGKIKGVGSTYYAGTIGSLMDHKAIAFAREYYKAKKSKRSDEAIIKIAKPLEGVKKCEYRHPGGIIVVPEGEDINTVSPVQNDDYGPLKMAHMEYWDMDHVFLKFDILAHSVPTMLRKLKDDTGVDPTDIPLNDPRMISLFTGVSELGITPDQIGGIDIGTLGVSEFSESNYLRNISKTVAPSSFSDIVRLLGLTHGTGVWDNNAELLFGDGKEIYELIANRDDIFGYLLSMGMDRKMAFLIMETVRKGKACSGGLSAEMLLELEKCGVPDWYIESFRKIMYLFPKAHSVNYALLEWRLLYYKLYHPEHFYRTWLEVRAEHVDMKLVRKGYEHAKKIFDDYNSRPSRKLSEKQRRMLDELPIVLEMLARGC